MIPVMTSEGTNDNFPGGFKGRQNRARVPGGVLKKYVPPSCEAPDFQGSEGQSILNSTFDWLAYGLSEVSSTVKSPRVCFCGRGRGCQTGKSSR